MGLDLSILYRGRLSGCNYDCHYCPFAKRVDDKATLTQDAADLARFVDWAETRADDALRILFTPWGEALIRKPYQNALVSLSQMPQIKRASFQTNLSCALDWTDDLDKETASLWCTYHPGEVTAEKFLSQCAKLDARDIKYSVGMVGIKDAFSDIAALQKKLPAKTYLWINAFKDEGPNYYSEKDVAFLRDIDPHFEINLTNYESLNRPCRAGHESISVDGNGDIRRCHFIPEVIGNIYAQDITNVVSPKLCSRKICDCHIGYANIPDLNLDKNFTGWALGRIAPTY